MERKGKQIVYAVIFFAGAAASTIYALIMSVLIGAAVGNNIGSQLAFLIPILLFTVPVVWAIIGFNILTKGKFSKNLLIIQTIPFVIASIAFIVANGLKAVGFSLFILVIPGVVYLFYKDLQK